MIAYHVTLGRSVPNILARGIQPRLGPRAKELGEAEKAVHLYRTKEDCRTGLGGWFKDVFLEAEIDDLVVMEVRLSKDMPIWKDRDDELKVMVLVEPVAVLKIWDADLTQDLSARFEPAQIEATQAMPDAVETFDEELDEE